LGLCTLTPAVTLTACGDDEAPRPPKRTLIRKDVHLHLLDSALGPGPLRGAKRLEMRVGSRRFEIKEHDVASRRAWSVAARATRSGDATHYAENVSFSAGGAQSYQLFRINQNGSETLIGGGIHAPTASDRARAQQSDPEGDDPTLQVTPHDAAVWLVFHDPSVMSLDADTAAKVIAIIGDTPSFTLLVDAIVRNFHVATPEEAEQMIGGWVIGRVRKQPAFAGGGDVTEVTASGAPVLDENGKPRRVVDWHPSTRVAPLVLRVIDEVMRAFNSDAAFEGVKYFSYAGAGARPNVPPLAKGVGAESESDYFVLNEKGRVREHRSFGVERSGEDFELRVDNWLALGAMFGVSHFDEDGGHKKTSLLGYVESTYYPSIATAAGAHAVGKGLFDRPDGTFTSTVWTSSLAAHVGDLGSHRADMPLTVYTLLGGLITAVCDIVLPGVLLAHGGAESFHARDELLAFARRELLTDAAVEAVKSTLFVAMNFAIGANDGIGDAVLDLLKNGLLAPMVHLVEKLVAGTLASSALYGLATLFAELIAENEAEEIAINAVPFVGWVMWGIDVATTIAQLAISTVHVVGSTVFTSATLQYTHPLKLRIKPADGVAYLPSYADHVRITITPPTGDAKVDASKLFERIVSSDAVPNGAARIEMTFHQVPLAPCNISVEIFDRDPDLTGAHLVGDLTYAYATPESTKPGEETEVELEIRITPPAVQDTVLRHDSVLAIGAAGARTWVFQTSAPPARADALSCFDGASGGLCSLNGISIRQSGAVAKIAYNYDTTYPVTGTLVRSPIMADITMPAAAATSPTQTASPPTPLGTRAFVYALSGARLVLSQSGTNPIEIFEVTIPRAQEVDLRTLDASALRRVTTSTASVLRSVRMNGDGTHAVLASEQGIEIIDLRTAAAADDNRPCLLYRRGSRAGQVLSPVAVAPFQTFDQFAVLDDGNARVEVFDYGGQRVDYFAEPWLTLVGAGRRVYLDLDVDVAGNVWVLSLDSGAPVLDVYSQKTELLRTTYDIRAMRFALDRYSQVFTLNAERLVPASGVPEPSISRWIPAYR